MTDPAGLVRERISESAEVKRAMLDATMVESIVAVAELITARLRAGHKIILCGNGGSAADAMHIAAELLGRFKLERASLPAISLSDNVSAMTAIGNDYDYTETFSRQVRGLGSPGDVLIGISTSGGSPNVLAAVVAAREIGMATVALTGAGGLLGERVEHPLSIPSSDTARIQEGYMLAAHVICELMEQALFPAANG